MPEPTPTDEPTTPQPPRAPESPPEERGFSIAFGWIGLILGGIAWVMWWGSQHLPERGQDMTREMFEFTTLDLVMMALLPFGAAAFAGRTFRKVLP